MPTIPELNIAVTSGTLLTLEQDGQVVACCEYDWVWDRADMLRADRGETPQGGPVLYVSNVRVFRHDPSLIRQLRRRLPKARWIVGLTEDWQLRAPKGVPEWF